MKNTNRNSKLQTALNQWYRIRDKEMAFSPDLRNYYNLNQANEMISKIKGMMK